MGKSSDGKDILAPEVTNGKVSSWPRIAHDSLNIRESCIIVLSVVIHIYCISKHNTQ